MRVLHIYSGNLFGGIESMLVSLARSRHQCGAMEPAFALAFDGRLATELRRTGVVVHELGEVRASRPLTARRARAVLDQLLRSGQFDRAVCHAAWSQAVFGSTVRHAGVPLVFWAHDALAGRHWTERWARRTCPDLVIANSRFTRRTVLALYPGARSEVVHPPVEIDSADSTDRDRVRAELETPAGALVVVQASRMEPWKGHRVLLEALARVRSVSVVWLAGGAQRPAESAYLASLHELAARLGVTSRVRFLGQRDDVPRLLRAADVHCQPNIAPEPFGVALVEALAAGLPVVTTAMGGAAEIVDDTCGRLVPPDDPITLSATLDELASDAVLRARLGTSAPARAAAVADPGRQLRALFGSLDAMAGERVTA